MTDKPDLKSRPVRAGETPLDANLGHRYLDVIREGGEAFDDGTSSPYSGYSLEHCLHATGWVQRDLRVALDRMLAEREATEARHAAELREQAERFSEALVAIRRKTVPQRLHDAFDELAAPFIIAKPDPLVEAIKDLSWDETTAAEEWAADLRAALAKHGLKLERIDQ